MRWGSGYLKRWTPRPFTEWEESKVITKLTLAPGETCEGKTRFPIGECPNMKGDPNDHSMEFEHYKCAVCGKRDKLDYEEMK